MPAVLRWLLRVGPLNPITVRLVQNGSRRVKHMYVRSAYLAALVLVLLWMLIATTSAGDLSYRELAKAGAESFTWIAYLQIALICILAPVFMAGAIAQEANPQTWNILLTTPMSALQIVVGNLVGRLFFILALLVASMPLFALTQYFGGVPGRAIFASYLVAGSAALLVGAIAVALSVSRLVGKRAVFAFYVSVVSYIAVTWALDAWLRAAGQAAQGTAGVTWMTAINPFLSLHALLNPSSYPRAPEGSMRGIARWFFEHPVSTWCWGSVLLSMGLIVVSMVTVRLGGIQMLSVPGRIPWYRTMLGLGAKGAEHRPPRSVGHNPIAWREASARNATLGRIIARWAFVAVGLLWGIALVAWYYGGSMTTRDFKLALMSTVWAEIAVTALVAINMSATAVSREREDGTLDLILTTPITPGQYLTGKLQGVIAYLVPMMAVPLGTLAMAGIFVIAGGFGGSGAVLIEDTPFGFMAPVPRPVVLPEAILVAPLVVVPFIAFCVMVGLHWSLRSKGTLASVVGTVGVVGAVSGVVGLCGWNAGPGVPVLGPVLSAMSPASMVYTLIEPATAMRETVTNATNTLAPARTSLIVGAAIAAAAYAAAVYMIHGAMVRQFDTTVRKLAGVK